MSTLVIELKVSIFNQKCKTGILKAVTSKVTGVDELKLDGEKGTLTVIGCVDPVSVVTALRKAGYGVEITSVGPPKKPDPPKPDPPKPDPKPEEPKVEHQCCPNYQCEFVGVSYATYDTSFCSIL